jgi:Peptidase dimerisation domain
LLRPLHSLHDENGDVTVPGLRREEWTGASYSDDEFRELAEVELGVPCFGTRGLGERLWTGPAVTVTGIDVLLVDRAVNAVVPYARAKLSLRVHPEQDPLEAQAALISYLEGLRPFGVSLTVHAAETGQGFAAETSGPAYEAPRAALASAWGSETVSFATGGSIPLVSALQEAVPDAEMLLIGTTDGVRQHPRSQRARPRRRVREGDHRGDGVLRPLRGDRGRRELRRVSESATPVPATGPANGHSFLERILDGVERLGNSSSTISGTSRRSRSSWW